MQVDPQQPYCSLQLALHKLVKQPCHRKLEQQAYTLQTPLTPFHCMCKMQACHCSMSMETSTRHSTLQHIVVQSPCNSYLHLSLILQHRFCVRRWCCTYACLGRHARNRKCEAQGRSVLVRHSVNPPCINANHSRLSTGHMLFVNQPEAQRACHYAKKS